MKKNSACPLMHGSITKSVIGTKNIDWWPNKLNLDILCQHDQKSNPMDRDFNYTNAVKLLDVRSLKTDLKKIMHDSKNWWPADYGHYGPFFIRMTWHAAGTYRIGDGRGGGGTGAQRFAPLNSWPDNVNLDKARRLLWPVKKKYGNSISWADLLIMAGNVAIEDMGGPTLGVALGRTDIWHSEKDIYWGNEDKWLGDNRYGNSRQDLENPLASVQMGLIYVNPEGPNGNPDPLLSAQDIRETFARMAMNDIETFSLIAGGHTFGKAHGNGPIDAIGAEPEDASIEAQGFGWKSSYKSGKGIDTVSSGIEGPWTSSPIQWDMSYLNILYKYDWKLTKSPAGAHIWHPIDIDDNDMAPEVNGSGKVTLMMTTADMALKEDPIYREIGEKFVKDPKSFDQSFAEAWFKLLHRDMGPKTNYVAGDFSKIDFIWQDIIPKGRILKNEEIKVIKDVIKSSDLSIKEMVETAWASAFTFRNSDKRGGANGARIRFAPMKDWMVNNPAQLSKVLTIYKRIASVHNSSVADVIVIGGAAGIEKICSVSVPVSTGRGDAIEKYTDVDSFSYLEPRTDGFRNYFEKQFAVSPEEMMLDKAQLLKLTPVEMTVLVGGMRAMGISATGEGIWSESNNLDNSWFITLLDMNVIWSAVGVNSYEAKDRQTGNIIRKASGIDLIFGSNSELRAIAEVYAQNDNKDKFIQDFITTWTKIMDLDRFDLKNGFL